MLQGFGAASQPRRTLVLMSLQDIEPALVPVADLCQDDLHEE